LNKTVLMYHNILLKNNTSIGEYDIDLESFKSHVKHVSERNVQDKVVFTFDDGYESNYDVAQILLEKQIKGIFFIITEKINSDQYLTRAQIKEMHEMGHTIGSHSHSHKMFNILNDKDARYELLTSKKIIEEIIENEIHHFAFPGGKYKFNQIAIANQIGYSKIYTSDEGFGGRKSIKRMHVRQSTKNKFTSIVGRSKLYYFKRDTRSRLIRLKDFFKTK